MYKKLLIQVLLVVVIVCSIVYTFIALRSGDALKFSEGDDMVALDTENLSAVEEKLPEMKLRELFRSDTKAFYCGYIDGGSTCRLVVSDSDGSNQSDLGMPFDDTDDRGHEAFQPSSDGRYVMVARGYCVVLIDANSLEQKVIYKAEPGTALGLFSGVPTFIPRVKWLSDKEVEVSIYNDNTPDPYNDGPAPAPLAVKRVTI